MDLLDPIRSLVPHTLALARGEPSPPIELFWMLRSCSDWRL